MSLLRISPARPLTAFWRRGARCISSSAPKPATDILDLLGGSARSQSHPANAAPQKLSPEAFARQSLPLAKPRSSAEEMEAFARTEDYTKHMYRRWKSGDVYAPHDLSGPEQKKWKFGRTTPQSDAFDVLGINPINEYKNYTMMSEYMTEMGRIKHSKQTGLRPVNQRKIAKAIRRAIGLGLMPSVHRHPLVVKKSSPTRFL